MLKQHPYDISGGQQQKVALAKVLAKNPDILLLDEPTKAIDGIYKESLGRLMMDLKNRGKTIVMVTHDPKMASYCSRLILLKDGMILEDMRNGVDQEAFYQEILGKMKEL